MKPLMAFNDVRISSGIVDPKMIGFERGVAPKNQAGRNLLSINGNKDRAIKPDDQALKSDSVFDKILQDLDFDKIMRKQNDSIISKLSDKQESPRKDVTARDMPEALAHDPNGKDIDDLFAVDHPLDYSFTKDKGYVSDDAKPRNIS